MENMVVGLVIGSRKCGTTWLYENFLEDPDVSVSRKVKESGFFARANDHDFAYYEGLFPESPGKRVEVDSSLAYSDTAPGKILAYNPRMRIALVLRDPVEYAVSRFLHMRRKRQLSAAHIMDVVTQDEILCAELDYPSITARFEAFQRQGGMLVVPYSLLTQDPVTFYKTMKEHLVGPCGSAFRPKSERVNVSRSSKSSAMTGLLSRAANAARKRRLHAVVNFAKRLKAHQLLEKPMGTGELADLRESVSRAVVASHGESVELYRRIEVQFGVRP
jgi:hypothetical protein